jgi:serine/threonine-protein kinase
MLSPTELITFLTRNQFLSPSQGEALNRDRAKLVSSVQLCGDLVQRGLMTPYQQAQLLSGNGDKLIIGSYRIQAPLGEGGMGMVFKAIQPKLDRVVALKVIRPQVLAARPEILSRFHREARAIAQLNHPNVVILFDADEVNGIHFIAMEYVEGPTLEKMVRTQGPMSIRQACEYMRQAALGLHHAYEVGLVHRDIKPSNILVAQKTAPSETRSSSMRMARPVLVTMRDRDRQNFAATSSTRLPQGWGTVKILDMGLARLTDGLDEDRPVHENTPLTRAGALLGTPDFISPEQARDARQVDIRADIYSLGCTLYYILTGKPPFPGGTDVQKLIRHQTEKPFPIEELRPGIPNEVTQILNRMLEKRPEDRYPTPRHLAEALDLYVNPALPSTPVPTAIAETPPVADTPVPHTVPRAPAQPAAARPAKIPTHQPPSAPASTPASHANAFRDTVPAPAASPMRDTMPVPPGLSEELSLAASAPHRAPPPASLPPTNPITRPRLVIPAHSGIVHGLAFSPCGRLLASAGVDGRVRMWDLSSPTPKEVGSFPKPGAEFHSVAFAPHDDYVAVGGVVQRTGRVWRWDWKESRVAEWGAYQGDKVGIPAMSFSADGKRFAAGIGPFVVAWKVNGRSAGTSEILKGHSGPVRAVAWSPDSRRLVSGGESQFVLVWGFGWLGASQKGKFRNHSKIVTALSFSRDGKRLASGGLEKTIALYDLESGSKHPSATFPGHSHHLRLVQFLVDGTLMSIAQNGHVLIWDLSTRNSVAEYHLSDRLATIIAATRDGKCVATGGSDGKVMVFDTARMPAVATVGS